MSIVSRYVSSSYLTPRALNSGILPFVSLLFLSGVPRVFDPVILWLWNTLFPSSMPIYLLEIASVFGWLSVVAGLMKYFASEDLSEELRIEGEVQTFGTEDIPIISLYLLFGYTAMVFLNVPLTMVTLIQGGVMLVLSMSFVTIPWYLWRFVDLPRQTDDLLTKTGVFIATVSIAGAASVGSLIIMRFVEFYL